MANFQPSFKWAQFSHNPDVDKNSIKYSKKDVDKSLDMYFARPKK
jgi:hypothetical protein